MTPFANLLYVVKMNELKVVFVRLVHQENIVMLVMMRQVEILNVKTLFVRKITMYKTMSAHPVK